jgi:hypothetical protein
MLSRTTVVSAFSQQNRLKEPASMSVPVERPAKQPAKMSQLLSTTAPQHQHGDDDSAGESAEQHNNESSRPERAPAPTVPTTAPPPTSPHRRQGDRSSSDDDAAPRLPVFVRFHDLRAAGIVSNWPQLYNLIDDYGFPSGVMLSPNTRAWRVKDVQCALANRPTERKKVVAPNSKQDEAATLSKQKRHRAEATA